MRYIQSMVDSKDRNILGLFQEKARQMAEYPDQNNYVTKDSEDEHTVETKRKNLRYTQEQASRRLEQLATEKTLLENRRREIIFLMEAEEALIEGANKAWAKLDNYDQADCAEETPENMPVSAAYDKNKGRGW